MGEVALELRSSESRAHAAQWRGSGLSVRQDEALFTAQLEIALVTSLALVSLSIE